MAGGPRTRILFYQLHAFFFLTVKSTRRKKKRKGQRGSVRGWQGEKSGEFYHQLLTEIAVENTPVFRELLRMTKTQFQGLVAGWLHWQLYLRLCRENFNSGDFLLAIFSPVPSPGRGWLYVRFSSRTGDATKFEKNRITCAIEKSLV